jgi:hypothetical protein
MRKVIVFCLAMCVLLLFETRESRAVQVVSFANYDLSNLRYTNRVRLSTDQSNFDFLSTTSNDWNNDGTVDFLETETFFTHESPSTIYIGNASTSYAVADALLWIGVDGEFNSFNVDSVQITQANALKSNDSSIVWPYSELKNYIDYVALVDMQQGIGKRVLGSAVNSCVPLSINLSGFSSGVNSCRMYIGAFGSITSGFNSFTPSNSDIVFMPKNDVSGGATPAVPEPGTVVCLGIGLVGLLKQKFSRR